MAIGIRTGTDPRIWMEDEDMLATALDILTGNEQGREEAD